MSDEELYQQYLSELKAQRGISPYADTAAGLMARSNQAVTGDPNAASPENIQRGADIAASMMTGGLSSAVPSLAKSAAGRLATPFLEGGALGAAQDKEDRLRGFLTGGATQGGISTIGKAVGQIGDVAMQTAVGRKKYTPGVGTELANQGLIGTQGMMRGQTQRRLGEVGKRMGAIAEDIQQPIDSRRIGREILDETTAPLTGGGVISPSSRDAGTIEQMQQFAQDIQSRGAETGAQALARRRAAGSSAYSARTQDPKLSPLAQASKLEQQKYSEALKAADPRMAPVDASYAALKKAEKALSEEPTLPRSLLGLASMTSKSIPGGSLVTSAVGRVGVTGGRVLEQYLAPMARQASVAQPSQEDPEYELYQQYLKETGQR